MITRTADTDDSGAGTDGTVHNNAWKTALYDAIDARWSENSTTSTGNQDNFSYSEADVLRCNNATTITLRGVLAPASPLKPGKRLIVVSVGAGTVVLNDQDANSTAANRIITGAGAAITLAAGTGFAWLEYDSVTARWRVVGSSVAVSVVPGSVRCIAFHSTTQAVTASSFNVLSLDSETVDTSTMHSNVTNNSRITIPVGQDGFYHVRGNSRVASYAGGTIVAFAIFVNGSSVGTETHANVAPAAQDLSVSKYLVLAAGDYVELAAFQDSSGSVNVGSATRQIASELSVVRIA